MEQKEVFHTNEAIDILGQTHLCCGGWPMLCTMVNSILGLYPLDVSRHPCPRWDNQKCLDIANITQAGSNIIPCCEPWDQRQNPSSQSLCQNTGSQGAPEALKGMDMELVRAVVKQKTSHMKGTRGNDQANAEPRKANKFRVTHSGHQH